MSLHQTAYPLHLRRNEADDRAECYSSIFILSYPRRGACMHYVWTLSRNNAGGLYRSQLAAEGLAMDGKNAKRVLTMLAIMGVMCATGCNRYHVIPDHLKNTVNRGVNFDQVKSTPASYQGEVIVIGGEILSAERLEDKTRIEVLQLPLKDDLTPTTERTESKGRFIAFDTGTEIVDPAVLKEGTPVTIIGEVKPPTEGHVGESQYEFPTLAIRDMTVWNKDNAAGAANRYYAYPAYGSYGYAYGYRPYNFMTGHRVREETRTSP